MFHFHYFPYRIVVVLKKELKGFLAVKEDLSEDYNDNLVEFAGFMITKDGIKQAAKYTASIKDFPTTSNISEVRAWYGLVNQLLLQN